MKKLLCVLMALCMLLCLGACGDGSGGGNEKEGPLTLTAQSRSGHDASFAMDGDVTTGWVGKRKASETTLQTLDIDLGKRTTFSRITIDDTFADGYTNKRPEYIQQSMRYRRGDATTIANNTSVPNVVNASVGQSWESTEIPTAEAPQKLYFTLTASCNVKKLVFDNDMNATALAHFAVYYSSAAVSGDGLDPQNYTLLQEVTDNTDNVYELVLPEAVTVTSMLLVVYSQTSSSGAVVASLDEMYFYAATAEDYTEPHQPVRFHLMGSNDGETFQVFAEENGNFNEIWEKQLDAPVTYRYIRYLVFEENGNNYPSIGEIKFE